MRLLTKREIDVKKSSERASEIGEGVKLARRVDNLREIQAEEEASLKRFREQTIANIHQEIVLETAKRDTLRGEVRDLEKRREDALKPLDAEWEKVHTIEKELSEKQTELVTRETTISEKEEEIKSVEKNLNDEEKRIAEMTARTSKSLKDAEEARVEAESYRVDSVHIKESALSFKKEVEKELRERDAVMASRERDLGNKEEANERDRRAIEVEKIQLADQRATLERAFKRIKK